MLLLNLLCNEEQRSGYRTERYGRENLPVMREVDQASRLAKDSLKYTFADTVLAVKAAVRMENFMVC